MFRSKDIEAKVKKQKRLAMPNENQIKKPPKMHFVYRGECPEARRKGAVVCDAVRCTSCRHGVVVGVVKWFVCRVGAVHWCRTSHRFSLKVDAAKKPPMEQRRSLNKQDKALVGVGRHREKEEV